MKAKMNNDARDLNMQALNIRRQFDANLSRIDEVTGFDVGFAVDTNEPVEPWQIDEADDFTLENNSRYSPTPAHTIRRILLTCPIQLEYTSFVDFGSGKGRAMLIASEFPFRKVIGVEFSSHLCEVARQNISNYKSDSQQCSSFEVHNLDASAFHIPGDASFFYFYEPFTQNVAAKVLENIESSIYRHPRQAIVCFVGKSLINFIEERSHWRQIGDHLISPDDPYYNYRFYSLRP